MLTVNIHEARTHLSRLVERAPPKGEPFVIAKAGKPLVKIVALDAPITQQAQRLGFMIGQIAVPDDFDRVGSAEIKELFAARPGAEGSQQLSCADQARSLTRPALAGWVPPLPRCGRGC